MPIYVYSIWPQDAPDAAATMFIMGACFDTQCQPVGSWDLLTVSDGGRDEGALYFIQYSLAN